MLVTSSTGVITSQLFFQNTVILRKPGVAIIADINKIITRFIKKIFKDSRKVKRIRNYVLKCNLYLYFLIYQNLLISGEKILMSAEVRGCVTWFIYFLLSLITLSPNAALSSLRPCKSKPWCPRYSSTRKIDFRKRLFLSTVLEALLVIRWSIQIDGLFCVLRNASNLL